MFHAGAEVDVLGIELVMGVAVPVEGDAVLEAERLQSLELPVARLVVRQDQASLVVQRLDATPRRSWPSNAAPRSRPRTPAGGLSRSGIPQAVLAGSLPPIRDLSRVVFAHLFSPSCRCRTGIHPGVLDTLLPCRKGPAVGSLAVLVLFQQAVDAVLVVRLVRNVVGQVDQPLQQVVVAWPQARRAASSGQGLRSSATTAAGCGRGGR